MYWSVSSFVAGDDIRSDPLRCCRYLAGSVKIWPYLDEILLDLVRSRLDLDKIWLDLVRIWWISSNSSSKKLQISSVLVNICQKTFEYRQNFLFYFTIGSGGLGFCGGNLPIDLEVSGSVGGNSLSTVGVVSSGGWRFKFGRVRRVGRVS